MTLAKVTNINCPNAALDWMTVRPNGSGLSNAYRNTWGVTRYDYPLSGMGSGGGLRIINPGQITGNNAAYCCGLNDSGEIGDNSTNRKSTPVSVVTSQRFVQLASGYSSTFGLTSDGICWSWGSNIDGQLGDNTIDFKSTPISVNTAQRFVQISSGASDDGLGGAPGHSLAIVSDGTCWAWGRNSGGQLGDTSTTSRSTPISVNTAQRFAQISAGADCSIGLTSDGTCWAWGNNADGQLGDNTVANKSTPVSVNTAQRFVQVACGRHSLGITADGICWAWGNNDGANAGSLGDNTIANKSTPISVSTIQRFIQVSVGMFEGQSEELNSYSLGLTGGGVCWAWGNNISGQIGDNSTNYRSTPVSVNTAQRFVQISANRAVSFGYKENGEVWAWGGGGGALGDGTDTFKSTPVLVAKIFS